MRKFFYLSATLLIGASSLFADELTPEQVQAFRRDNASQIAQRKSALGTEWDAIAIMDMCRENINKPMHMMEGREQNSRAYNEMRQYYIDLMQSVTVGIGFSQGVVVVPIDERQRRVMTDALGAMGGRSNFRQGFITQCYKRQESWWNDHLKAADTAVGRAPLHPDASPFNIRFQDVIELNRLQQEAHGRGLNGNLTGWLLRNFGDREDFIHLVNLVKRDQKFFSYVEVMWRLVDRSRVIECVNRHTTLDLVPLITSIFKLQQHLYPTAYFYRVFEGFLNQYLGEGNGPLSDTKLKPLVDGLNAVNPLSYLFFYSFQFDEARSSSLAQRADDAEIAGLISDVDCLRDITDPAELYTLFDYGLNLTKEKRRVLFEKVKTNPADAMRFIELDKDPLFDIKDLAIHTEAERYLSNLSAQGRPLNNWVAILVELSEVSDETVRTRILHDVEERKGPPPQKLKFVKQQVAEWQQAQLNPVSIAGPAGEAPASAVSTAQPHKQAAAPVVVARDLEEVDRNFDAVYTKYKEPLNKFGGRQLLTPFRSSPRFQEILDALPSEDTDIEQYKLPVLSILSDFSELGIGVEDAADIAVVLLRDPLSKYSLGRSEYLDPAYLSNRVLFDRLFYIDLAKTAAEMRMHQTQAAKMGVLAGRLIFYPVGDEHILKLYGLRITFEDLCGQVIHAFERSTQFKKGATELLSQLIYSFNKTVSQTILISMLGQLSSGDDAVARMTDVLIAIYEKLEKVTAERTPEVIFITLAKITQTDPIIALEAAEEINKEDIPERMLGLAQEYENSISKRPIEERKQAVQRWRERQELNARRPRLS